jgi:general stress protein 26
MKTMTSQNPQLAKLSQLIDGIDYAMLTTREADGTLHTRPMRTEAIQDDGTLLFFTQADSAKARELQQHSQVSISYMGDNAATCVAIAGHARLLRDRAKMKELWKSLYKVWFPKGLEDPELVLLRITIDRAEYWETPSNPVVRVVGAAKALATGKPIGEQVGEHEQMTLRKRR